MRKITVKYRESFAGSCPHTGLDEYDGDIEMKDRGIWIHYIRNNDGKRMKSFYPNISIIRVDVEEDIL